MYDGAMPEDDPVEEKPRKTKRQRRAEERKARLAEKCPLCRHPVVDHERIAHAPELWCHACLEKCGEKGNGGKRRNH